MAPACLPPATAPTAPPRHCPAIAASAASVSPASSTIADDDDNPEGERLERALAALDRRRRHRRRHRQGEPSASPSGDARSPARPCWCAERFAGAKYQRATSAGAKTSRRLIGRNRTITRLRFVEKGFRLNQILWDNTDHHSVAAGEPKFGCQTGDQTARQKRRKARARGKRATRFLSGKDGGGSGVCACVCVCGSASAGGRRTQRKRRARRSRGWSGRL